mgnify:CR=1 FL=1
MATTAILGIGVVALHLWWIATHRDLGAYNVDEAGYMATALRFHRSIDPAHPAELVRAVFTASNTGPLVPVLALPGLVVGQRTILWVSLVQPLLAVGTAVAAAGLTTRLSSRAAGLVAGVVALGLPALINSARNFQYATGTAMFLLLALWAVLASERGEHRWRMVLFGAATGAMLLTRTMSIGFVPGLGVAALLQLRWSRRTVANLAIAAGVAVLVAGPWWFVSRDALYDYLFRFGYGDMANTYGPSGLGDKLDLRLNSLDTDIRSVFLGLGISTWILAALTALIRRPRIGRELLHHGIVASAAVVLVGYGLLLTTSNQGVWFEVPLELVAVCTTVAVGWRLPRRLGTGMATAAVAIAIGTLAISLTDTGGPIDGPGARLEVQRLLAGGLDERERVLGDADPLLLSTDRSTRERGAGRWWQTNLAIVDKLEEYRRDDQLWVFTVSGSSHLLNGQSLLLAEELTGKGFGPMLVPRTDLSDQELDDALDPIWLGTHRRLLVLMFPESLPFPEDRQVPKLLRMARERGYRQIDRMELPDGGHVLFLEHPDRPPRS